MNLTSEEIEYLLFVLNDKLDEHDELCEFEDLKICKELLAKVKKSETV